MRCAMQRLCNRSEIGKGYSLSRMMDSPARHYALDIRDSKSHGTIVARGERSLLARDGSCARGGSPGIRSECVS